MEMKSDMWKNTNNREKPERSVENNSKRARRKSKWKIINIFECALIFNKKKGKNAT